MSLSSVYNPQTVEDKWYQFWLDNGYFRAKPNKDKKPYSIVMPPPNITGQLHTGHALDSTLQDILIRFKRMQGYEALWLPGTDHASIATEARIVAAMQEEGLTKDDLGREGFLERAWEWKRQYGGRIISQLKKMGSSCDWDRERFTMDEGCSKAVKEVFVNLYNKDLIYRGERIINWCPYCLTSISDAEVEYEDQAGHFWHLRYPYSDGSGYIEMATTRPETMLGDTAVAVNPNDARYKDCIGKTVTLPLVGRQIPVIADEYVEMEFGTGVVKITPAHDSNDFEVGLRHNLPIVNVLTEDAKIVADYPKYAGMDRYEARKAIVEDLQKCGALTEIEEHSHNVGTCYRCGTTVEPRVSLQWFVKMDTLATPAIDAVKNGDTKFVPDHFDKTYFHWLENIRDWCISRQLWWGHRIPAFYCDSCGEMTVTKDDSAICPKCGQPMRQDPDTLDTWFSSALWPFSTLGWPDQTEDFKYFYPTSTLVTGYDIIFFWVIRMMFSGLAHCGEVPFKTVLIHGLVRDAQGRKMSKSLGNGIDPIEIIEQYGADALRFTLASGTSLGQDQRLQTEKIEGSRNFTNKLWNAARFVLMQYEKVSEQSIDPAQEATLLKFTTGASAELPTEWLALADEWILTRIQQVKTDVTEMLERLDIGSAAAALYDFFWSEYCDWYIELSKQRLNSDDVLAQKTVQAVLVRVLRETMEMLHPFIPFITEEIWQSLPHTGDSIMRAAWPQSVSTLRFEEALKDMNLIIDVVKGIRNARAEANVPSGKKIPAFLMAAADREKLLQSNLKYITNLASLEQADFLPEGSTAPDKAVSAVVAGVTVYLPLSGLVDVGKEIERLTKELTQLTQEIERTENRLSSDSFVSKAPAQVVEKEKAKVVTFKEKAAAIQERLKQLQ